MKVFFFELALKKEAGMMDIIWFVIFLARMGVMVLHDLLVAGLFPAGNEFKLKGS
ncbi:hypothetical protein [Enterococcus sp. AZ196]|uniref:hypothetical protein n=1 Tax=Enterococcus sp. AZ196 TaxID=2774659 RepID=UPI003D2E7230